jgi:pimeloyl-ACP methyl ester carboxylesterase
VGLLATTGTGSGPAVLLLHGLNGFKEGWGPLPATLAAAGLSAAAVDLPGFGHTPPLGRGRHTPDALAEAIGPLVGRLAPVGLVGHSFGGQVAMIAACRWPERVSRVALLGGFLAPREPRFPPRRISDLLGIPGIGRPLARLVIARIRRSPERRRQSLLSAVAEPERLDDDPEMTRLLDAAVDAIGRADLRAMVDWAASGIAADVRSLAARMPQPTLVVTGDLDRVAPAGEAAALAAALPAGALLRLPGVAHFPHLERPEPVGAALAAHFTA